MKSNEITLSGVANKQRRSMAERGALAVVGLGLSALAIGACGSEADNNGVVHVGADGKKYVLPENPVHAVYKSKADCVADVSAQIKQIESDSGDKVKETPSQLCEDAASYNAHGGSVVILRPGSYYGPVISQDSEWHSNRAAGWTAVTDGEFAAPGHVTGGIAAAPEGAVSGEHASFGRGGFGSIGKVSFGHAVGE